MDPIIAWLLILVTIAIIMFAAEVFVPSGGLLAVIGTGCLIAAIVLCFWINRWVGITAMVVMVVAAPFLIAGGLSLWQRTPIGRKMVLSTTVGELSSDRVLVGTEGISLTDMRPMGECEFGDIRIEARSEMGRIIPAGRRVKIIEYHDTVATVREVITGSAPAAQST